MRVLVFAALIILAAVVLAQMAERYWNGRFDRACSGQYPKYQVVDACQRTAKCVLSADEPKLKNDFDERCTIDFSCDRVRRTALSQSVACGISVTPYLASRAAPVLP